MERMEGTEDMEGTEAAARNDTSSPPSPAAAGIAGSSAANGTAVGNSTQGTAAVNITAAAGNSTSSNNSTSGAPTSGGGSDGTKPTTGPPARGALRRDAMILEGWNGDGTERTFTLAAHYKSLRVCTEARLLNASTTNASSSTNAAASGLFSARYVLDPGVTCYKYTVWCQGNWELYDLAADPFELNNRIQAAPARALNRLDAVLSALVHCSGASCRNPYSLLHPGGDVRSFAGTMDPRHDRMYDSLVKLSIKKCVNAYLPANEVTWTQGVGPQPFQFSAASRP
ncbi:hypothetical protein HXX76_001083 [Chlamydomonas incerta]|uniref:Uncharacterized protein n=1 Tax=Chlamydomonas incerta TaxID=51695 RepID=A0A835WBM4_CHLIN|nr:hypothetical protein HXX76_001083 [Chlamydomonas incerta]|eukprot:KAG2444327.1 hypothetical protein HXX76_001083 [Chlamydomonas incerta]